MIIRRNVFFGCLFAIVIFPFLSYKIYWITYSKQVSGVMAFVGKTYATDQIVHVYSVIKYPVGNDTLWFNGNDNIFFQRGDLVPVRYQVNDPSDARIDIFTSIWGDTIVYGGIPLLIVLISFIHPQMSPIVPGCCCISSLLFSTYLTNSKECPTKFLSPRNFIKQKKDWHKILI